MYTVANVATSDTWGAIICVPFDFLWNCAQFVAVGGCCSGPLWVLIKDWSWLHTTAVFLALPTPPRTKSDKSILWRGMWECRYSATPNPCQRNTNTRCYCFNSLLFCHALQSVCWSISRKVTAVKWGPIRERYAREIVVFHINGTAPWTCRDVGVQIPSPFSTNDDIHCNQPVNEGMWLWSSEEETLNSFECLCIYMRSNMSVADE